MCECVNQLLLITPSFVIADVVAADPVEILEQDQRQPSIGIHSYTHEGALTGI